MVTAQCENNAEGVSEDGDQGLTAALAEESQGAILSRLLREYGGCGLVSFTGPTTRCEYSSLKPGCGCADLARVHVSKLHLCPMHGLEYLKPDSHQQVSTPKALALQDA